MRYLTPEDIQRMKCSVSCHHDSISVTSDTLTKKDTLKKKSRDRVAGWSDTLESHRKAKLQWKQDALDREEAKRIEMDQMEAKEQEDKMQSLLERGKALQYEGNEKVKQLRSQQLYTEVLETRLQQIHWKCSRESEAREEEMKWYKNYMSDLQREDSKHQEKIKALKLKAVENATFMNRQKKEAEMLKRYSKERTRHEEQAIIWQIEQENKEARSNDMKQKVEAKERAKKEMDKIALDTEAKRKLEIEREAMEQQKREKDIARMMSIAKTRADLERKHFEEKQAARKILSDKASQELQLRAQKEIEMFIRNQKAQELKEQARILENELNKKKLEEEVRISRQNQIEKRIEEQRLEIESDKCLAEYARQKCIIETENERVKQLEKIQQSYDYRKFQEEQIREKKKNLQYVLEADKAEDEKAAQLLIKEDEKFKDFAFKEMEKFLLQGKTTKLLSKVLSS